MFCCRDKMAVVAHLVGIDQLGYEKELGMTPSVSFPVWRISTTDTDLSIIMCQVMKNDKSWRGMLLKDNEGDWGVAVAAWRGMKKGQPGIPGNIQPLPQIVTPTAFSPFPWMVNENF